MAVSPRWPIAPGRPGLGPGLGLAAALALTLTLGACCPRPPLRAPWWADRTDARLTLYRDGAFVEEAHQLDVDAGASRVRLPWPLGVAGADLLITSPDVEVASWTAVDDAAAAERAVAVDVVAKRAGPARFVVAYQTERVTWTVGYTLILEAGSRRGSGRLHGAVGLTNRTGRRWERARFAVVDRPRPTAPPTESSLVQRPVEVPGTYAVRPGSQRLDLALRGGGLPLRPILVYDPVGPRLDSPNMRPQMDERYGVEPWPASVDESLLVDLSRVADGPLPAGPVRVFAVGEGGALVWRGEGRLLPPAADAELYTTVAVGRSADVTGTRRRTDFSIDHERMRLVEEVTLTLHNAGPRAAEVLAREHLYRGQCWTLAYASVPQVAKEGAQQIGLGVTVAAGADATVMYRVVYEWDDRTCRLSTSSN